MGLCPTLLLQHLYLLLLSSRPNYFQGGYNLIISKCLNEATPESTQNVVGFGLVWFGFKSGGTAS